MQEDKKDELKMSISLPASELLNQTNDVRQVMEGNWKIIPLLMFVEE